MYKNGAGVCGVFNSNEWKAICEQSNQMLEFFFVYELKALYSASNSYKPEFRHRLLDLIHLSLICDDISLMPID